MSEYYKSLISDDEVIQALIKESKRREGTLTETTASSRLKPNLNFFQRTVNNLISNNRRIGKSVNSSKGDYSKHPKTHTKRHKDVPKPKRLPINHAYEKQLVLERKINYSRAEKTEKPREKPYRSSSKRIFNKSLLKYINELSTDSSDSEPDPNSISKCPPGQYYNHSSNTEPKYIEKRSSKTKNLSQKYIKIDENSTNDSEPEVIEYKNGASISNISFKDIPRDTPKKYLKSEYAGNTIICISSDSSDTLEEIEIKKNHKTKKKE